MAHVATIGAAAAAPPWTPETATFAGKQAAAWAALVAAGPAGAGHAEICAAMYPSGDLPASWRTTVATVIRDLRRAAEMNGHGLPLVAGAKPSRWRIRRPGEAEAEAPASPETVKPVPSKKPIAATRPEPAAVDLAPTVATLVASPRTDATSVLRGLTGAASALSALPRGCCRWPHGEPGSEAFRYCAEPVRDEGKSYCPEHLRVSAVGTHRRHP